MKMLLVISVVLFSSLASAQEPNLQKLKREFDHIVRTNDDCSEASKKFVYRPLKNGWDFLRSKNELESIVRAPVQVTIGQRRIDLWTKAQNSTVGFNFVNGVVTITAQSPALPTKIVVVRRPSQLPVPEKISHDDLKLFCSMPKKVVRDTDTPYVSFAEYDEPYACIGLAAWYESNLAKSSESSAELRCTIALLDLFERTFSEKELIKIKHIPFKAE